MNAPRRLPGIEVDVAPPAAVDALPRMDVAAFVGFASTGPLHLPVAVESAAQFAAVFGADAPLAFDLKRGERAYAHLGPSVRAFFANGGRRCWVLRVAHCAQTRALRGAAESAPPDALSNRFPVPGVLALGATGALDAAWLDARCEGAWSDPLRLACATLRRGIALSLWQAEATPGVYRFDGRQPLAVGEVLCIGDDADLCAYLCVESVAAGSAAAAPYTVRVRLLAAFARVNDLGALSPPQLSCDLRITGEAGTLAATLHAPTLAPASAGAVMTLDVYDARPARLAPGTWLQLDDGGDGLWMRADTLVRGPAPAASPASSSEQILRQASGPVWRLLGDGALDPRVLALLAAPTSAQALRLELRVSDTATNARGDVRLGGLGLSPQTTPSAWTLQRDAEYYRARADVSTLAPERIARFPLAATPDALPQAWLPLGVGSLFGAAMPPLHAPGTALERDGLSQFDRSLFLDPALAGDSVDALLAHAEDIRVIREDARDLVGIHAVLGIGAGGLSGECSLIAVPDATHLGWRLRAVDALEAGEPPQPPAPPHWLGHRGACLAGDAAAAGIDPGALTGPDFSVFLDRATRAVDAPLLAAPASPQPPGALRLSWSAVTDAEFYTLEEAALEDFADAREVYRGADTEFVALALREGVYRHRVFAHIGGERSAASNAVAVQVRAEDWALLDETDPLLADAEWLAVHRAVLRLCAATGDLFAVLSMPRHFRTPQALRHAERLRSVRSGPLAGDPQAFAFNEAAALSYGALYLPWLRGDARRDAADITRSRTAQARTLPADGFALGVLAARARLRGAWVASANEALRDTNGLTPLIPDAERQALQDAQINLLRDDPRGFLALSADTLAHDIALRPINVRRLLTLLRRLALRRGSGYVFEPNGPVLRRAVQRGFEILLEELFRRGAFAGASAAQAFRVVTDEGVNTRGSVEAGRLIVELRVAPSLPMRFIAVRLAHSGERLSVVESL